MWRSAWAVSPGAWSRMMADLTRRKALGALALFGGGGGVLACADARGDRAALRQAPAEPGSVGVIGGDRFVFRTGNFADAVVRDRLSALFLASDRVPVTRGAWVRDYTGPAAIGWFDVDETGMDGVADDSRAIEVIVDLIQAGHLKQLRWDRTLRHTGRGRQPGAVTLIDVQSVLIDMTGGQLLMDNLSPRGEGSGSAFWWGGSCHDCTMRNPNIRWARRPQRRSRGDGITVKSQPRPGVASRLFRIEGEARIAWTPQAGIIFMGCDQPSVEAATLDGTLADGLHFNACRAPRFGRVERVDTTSERDPDAGDDTVALVTYHGANEGSGARPPADWKVSNDPWSRAELDEWSNGNAVGGRVISTGGRANAVRIAGAINVRLGSIQAEDKRAGSALIVDSAEQLGPDAAWRYRASRNVRIGEIKSKRCETAVQIISRNARGDSFRDFDVQIESVESSQSLHAAQILSANGLTIGRLISREAAKQAVKITGGQNIRIGTLVSRSAGAEPALVIEDGAMDVAVLSSDLGGQDALLSGERRALARISVTRCICRNFVARSAIDGLDVDGLTCLDGHGHFEGDPVQKRGVSSIRDIRFKFMTSRNSPGYGFLFSDVIGLNGGRVEIRHPLRAGLRGEMRAMVLDRASNADLSYDLIATDPRVIALSLGGGRPGRASRNVIIRSGKWQTPKLETTLLVQEGQHRPTAWRVTVDHVDATGRIASVRRSSAG